MGRNHRVVQGAMPAGGAASCHHYRGHRAQGGCTAHGAAYGQRAAFFGSILIEEEATIPTVNPRRNHGEMGVALGRLWGELQQEVGETDDGVMEIRR